MLPAEQPSEGKEQDGQQKCQQDESIAGHRASLVETSSDPATGSAKRYFLGDPLGVDVFLGAFSGFAVMPTTGRAALCPLNWS